MTMPCCPMLSAAVRSMIIICASPARKQPLARALPKLVLPSPRSSSSSVHPRFRSRVAPSR
eukprot:3199495-Prymnesium_polylepis.1